MAPFSKPETVLKQAEGLVSVGQTHAALQSLTEMFSSKRFRSTPLTSLEPIMLRFIELCVDMRKGRTAKEGLMQYKNLAQNTNVASIEVVISKFIQLADAKVQEAQEKADKAVALTDVDDLEASETPESILLGAVSGDQSKDRTDRALVTPWLKFLWESYRTALETLKNNARLEVIYQQIAQQAFKFCLKHERKVEFRRLCETLRLHLANVAKYAHQQHAINLADPDTLQHHLDTRFAQLNTSVELELWQEAFRSVEDVHNLLTMAKKAPRPSMMANYYEKLTRIFLMSGNALYHAAAWGRYYAIVTTIGGKSSEELGRLAEQVLVSALAVPVGTQGADAAEESKGRSSRLTALLGLSKAPTRKALLQDALSRGVLKLCSDSIKSLYNILEVTFDPLTLCSSISPLFASLSQDASYSGYLPLLQRALLSRLLSQLSQVYSSIAISQLLELVAPLKNTGLEGSDTFDDEQVEAYIMRCARRGELNIRVDHVAGSITFIDSAFAVIEDPSSSTMAAVSAVQPSTSEVIRTSLGNLATSLHNSLLTLYPTRQLTEEEQQAKFEGLVAAAAAERKALLLRRSIVARRRELLSELSVRKEKEAASRRAEISRREKDEEAKRTAEEQRRRELDRAKREIESIRAEEAKKLAQSLKAKGSLKVDLDDMENLSTDNIMRLQVEQLEKEKKELSERMRVATKRLDHTERAYRKDERPLLSQDYEVQQANDKAAHEAAQKARIENYKLSHEQDIETKRRLLRMMDDYKARRDVLVDKRGEEFAKRKATAERKILEEKTKRREFVMKQREEERQRLEEEERIRREQEEEEARLEEERIAEEERVAAEEAAAAEAAEREKAEAEAKAAEARQQREAERQAGLERARLQAQREAEAEARAAARRAEREAQQSQQSQQPPREAWRRPGADRPAAPTTPSRGPASLPPARSESPVPAAASGPPKFRPGANAAGGGGWRARAAAKEAGGPPAPSADVPSRSASPAPPKAEQPGEDDGFQKVPARGGGVWRSRRGRGL
ncbi:eukaryotic translation initiation factor 3 subunit A [Steccherinum ochraceum]|uniref:Eukaryotic translation initiation factor 3 subunit A n=1 Tax=Steccherinum ochraceum TaxID=92696 RepID=A0A4R0S1F1_9APHY|nr:eukaryotic translation initiation factor 3 subunit A [Steccherinum ochraceum]